MIVVGLGSNLGSREAHLVGAELWLGGREDVSVAARSALYHTPPLGPPQPSYLNAALRLETSLHPAELLPVLQGMERALGRVRGERWGPRTLDLDILYWSGGAVEREDLIVPHPRLLERDFALAPLLDVAPDLRGRFAADPPPRRAWACRPEDTLDAVDALAMRTTIRLGAPDRVSRAVAFTEALPDFGPGFVTLHRWDAQIRRGSKLL